MDRSRREYLARLGSLAGGAIVGSVAGCVSDTPEGTATERTTTARSPLVEDWRRTFEQSWPSFDLIGRLAVSGSVLATAGLTHAETDAGESYWIPWIEGFDTDGTQQWQYLYEPSTGEPIVDGDERRANGWGVFGLKQYDGGFVAGLRPLRSREEAEEPVLVRLDGDGTERWSRQVPTATLSPYRNGDLFVIASPGDRKPKIYVPSNEPDGAGHIRITVVRLGGTVANQYVVNTETFGRVDTIKTNSNGTLALFGRDRSDDELVSIAEVSPNGSIQREATIGSNWSMRYPEPISAPDDCSVLAVNSVTPAFFAYTDVVELSETFSVVRRWRFDGWNIANITCESPFAPSDGFILTMRPAGENASRPPGASFVAIDGNGEISWRSNGAQAEQLPEQADQLPRFSDAVVANEQLFVGGATPDHQALLVTYSPAAGTSSIE
ncbi:hypothetical protein [Halapricum hydrolyticum]|uniref:Uncharacterized protein n=1 Tax=Halapricum hydrolyticum TaxID=2979991 RepID=A0AAE3I8J5_9EURY|nr:hypothetical protein [Halapricum hydrolyticum]MCU4716749.1 hypothetical protein [Halapricum hydrolyticum]MCU4725646.1 hypothetical protein [Halapricum hydrolyticum]